MNFSLEKLRSLDATVMGIVSSIKAVEKFGKIVVCVGCHSVFFNCTWYQCLQCLHFFSKHVAIYIWTLIVTETVGSFVECRLNQAYCKISLFSLSRDMKMTKKPPCPTVAPGKGSFCPCLRPTVFNSHTSWNTARATSRGPSVIAELLVHLCWSSFV